MHSLLEGLNPQQSEGVIHNEGPLLIVAGAGSGKTTVLTRRAAYLLSLGIAPERILIVTFTNKAAEELRERLEELVGSAGRRVVATTFHSFCLRHLLRPYGAVVGLEDCAIFDDADQRSLVKSAIEHLAPSEKDTMHRFEIKQKMIESEMGLARSFGLSPEEYLAEVSTADERYPLRLITSRVWGIYRELLKVNNGVDFDGILETGLQILEANQAVLEKMRRRFQRIMVDEFQDTNVIQASIIRLLARPQNNITVVGDARQSIYRFRGSHIGVILGFQQEYPGSKLIELPINYRSTGPIVDVANTISARMVQKVGELEMVAGGAFSALQNPPLYTEYGDDREEADGIADRICDLIQSGESPESIAVLYRSRVLKPRLEVALISRSVPYTVVGDLSFFQRKEIRDVIALLRLAHNQGDGMAWLRVIDAVKPGVSTVAIRKLAEENDMSLSNAVLFKASGSGKVARRLQEIREHIVSLRDILRRDAVDLDRVLDTWRVLLRPALVKAVDAQMKGASADARNKSIAAREQNVSQLLNTLHQKAMSVGFDEAMEDLMLLADDAPSGDKVRQPSVKLMTIHASKGLEFDHVFLPGLEENLIPGQAKSEDELEEERRIFYVAVTRAKKSLRMSWVFQRMLFGKVEEMAASRFVAAVIDHLVEEDEIPATIETL